MGDMRGALHLTDEEVVSTGFVPCKASSFFESARIALNGNFVNLAMWYDSEWGYSTRLAGPAICINSIVG